MDQALVAPPRPVIEIIHGVTVQDPYRWLEDGKDPEVRRWAAAQDRLARETLSRLPFREKVRKRLEELYSVSAYGTPVPRKGKLFYLYRSVGQNQYALYVLQPEESGPRVLLDLNELSPEGTTAVDWFYPSPDGSRVAIGLSEGGTEQSTLYVIETQTGQRLADRLPNTRACSVAWLPDSSGFYYTRYPKAGTVPPGEEHYHRWVYLHRLGDDETQDELVFGPGRDPRDWPGVDLSPNGRWLVVTVRQGWVRSEVFLADRTQEPHRFLPLAVGYEARFDPLVLDDVIYLRTDLDAPRYRLLAVDPARPAREEWKEVLPESQDVLVEAHAAGEHLVVHHLQNASSRLRLYTRDAQLRAEVQLPGLGTLTGLEFEPDQSRGYVSFQSFVRPTEIYELDTSSGAVSLWNRVTCPIDPDRYVVEQVWYSSKDATKVPMFLVYLQGLAKTGRVPTVLYGYGGFGLSLTPMFMNSLPLWLDSGGLFAVANLRGGSEFGEQWHQAGMLGRKQNVFDDFIAAAEWLIQQGYTRPEKLAIMGRSNGGLLVAACLTQRPELYRAVVCAVPLTDMVRYHHFLIAKLWIPEYGDPDNPEHFQWLYRYSPYHRIRDGQNYPAVLVTTGEQDTRVDPAHARKFAARLAAASRSGLPVLLRVEPKAGHGAGKPLAKIVDEETDVWTFLFWQLDVEPVVSP
jgi:prolyl oligopeptidase